MKLKVFGPNLRDQSKGQFVVHAAGCADCGKLRGEECLTGEFASRAAVAETFYQIGETTLCEALAEFHFAPCVTLEKTNVNP